jgi:hypothetical protein
MMDCTPTIAGCSEYSSMMARPFMESSCNVCADGYLRQQNGYLSPDALGVVYFKYNCSAVVPVLPRPRSLWQDTPMTASTLPLTPQLPVFDTPTNAPAPSVKAAALWQLRCEVGCNELGFLGLGGGLPGDFVCLGLLQSVTQ